MTVKQPRPILRGNAFLCKKECEYTPTEDSFARMYGSEGAFLCFFMQFHTIERFSKEKYVKIAY